MKYKYKIGDKVRNETTSGKKSAIIVKGEIISLSTGEEVNKFQPSKPGPYYYVKTGPFTGVYPDGWIVGMPEEGLELDR